MKGQKAPVVPGGKTIALPGMWSPRCGTCGGQTFFRAERFDHSDEVRVICVCTGSCDFAEEARVFNGAAWDARGVELLRDSYTARSPFSKTADKPKDAIAVNKPANPRAWWKSVAALETGDIIVGPVPNLEGPQRLNVGERVVVVTTTQGARDVRVRYRAIETNRYGTFTCGGTGQVQIIGNEYLPNEAVAAGAVETLQPGDRIAWREKSYHKYAHGTVEGWDKQRSIYVVRIDKDDAVNVGPRVKLTLADVADRDRFAKL